MSYISDIEEEINALLPEYLRIKLGVDLKKIGKHRYSAVCTYHNDTNPSLFIDTSKGVCNCLGLNCDLGGNTFTVANKLEGLPTKDDRFSYYTQTLPYLAGLLGIHYKVPGFVFKEFNERERKIYAKRDSIRSVFRFIFINQKVFFDADMTEDFFKKNRGLPGSTGLRKSIGVLHNPEKLKNALDQRFSDKLLITCNLKIKKGNNITFNHLLLWRDNILLPIFNSHGNIVGINARRHPQFDNDESCTRPKYFHSTTNPLFDKSKILGNWHRAKKFDTVYGIEGGLDGASLEVIGIRNYFELNGSGFTEYQEDIVKDKRVLFLLDNDTAGRQRFLQITEHSQRRYYFINLGITGDPNDYVKKQIRRGKSLNEIKDMFLNLEELSRAEVMIDLREGFPHSVIQKIMEETLKESPYLQRRIIKRLSQKSKKNEKDLLKSLEHLQTKQNVYNLKNITRLLETGNIRVDMKLDVSKME